MAETSLLLYADEVEKIGMPKKVEFLFDVGSPTAYLAYTQLPSIASNAEA